MNTLKPLDALARDPATGFWLARSPALVEALLNDARFGVRPPAQPLPPHLAGRLLGTQFAAWVRMRDDAGHAAAKVGLVAVIRQWPEPRAVAREQALIALDGGWNHWIWAVSLCSMARLLGLAVPNLPAQTERLAQFRLLAGAIARADALDAADAACAELLEALAPAPDLPNRLGLLWQSFEAGAALLGQALIALRSDTDKRRSGSVADWLPTLGIQPGVILSTRRFARVALQWGQAQLQPGDGVLLSLNDDAHSFGAGAHRCPGRDLALAIAAEAVETLIASGVSDWPAPRQVLTLPNARIPIFEEPQR